MAGMAEYLTSAGATLGGTAMNTAGNVYMQERQFQEQAKMQRDAYEMNMRSQRESPSAQVEGLEAAGINPATMAGNFQGAPTMTPGTAASGSMNLSSIFEGLADIIAASKAPSEIKKTEAETEAITEQGKLTKEQKEKVIRETKLTDIELDNINNINWQAIREFKLKYPEEWKQYVSVQQGKTDKDKEELAWQSATIGLLEGKVMFHGKLAEMAVSKYQGLLAESMKSQDYIDAVKKLTTEQANIIESQAKTVQRQFEQLDWLTGYGKIETSAYAREKTAEVKKLEDEAEKWADKLEKELNKLTEETSKLKTSSAKDISDIINTSIGTGLKAVETILRAKGLSTIADKVKNIATEAEKKASKGKKGESPKKESKPSLKDEEEQIQEGIDNAGGLGMSKYIKWKEYA